MKTGASNSILLLIAVVLLFLVFFVVFLSAFNDAPLTKNQAPIPSAENSVPFDNETWTQD